MANTAVRQDKLRKFVCELESTVGTFEFSPGAPSGTEPIYPCRASSRLGPSDAEAISNADALDGHAVAIASTRGASGMGGTIETEIRDYSGSLAFPPHVKQLLASGLGCSHDGGANTITLTPSTKPLANWPGNTAGDRDPASMSIAEVLIDNATADELVPCRGAVLASKIVVDSGGIMTVSSDITGLVVGSEFCDFNNTDLSGFGGLISGQGVDPVVVKGATVTVNYVDDSGSTAITTTRLRTIEVDLAPTITRIEDPSAAEGWGVSPVFYDDAISVTLSFADSSAIAEDICVGYFSQRGFLDVTIQITTGTGRYVELSMPFVQYDATRETDGGARMFSLTGRAVRQQFGDTTDALTYVWKYA